MRICATTSFNSSSSVAFPGPGIVAAAAFSLSLKFVFVANVVPRRLLPGPVRSTTGIPLSVELAAAFSLHLIGFHFLDLDVATVIASSVSSAGDDTVKSSFLALAMTSARLSGFDPESESFGSDLVLLSASVVCLPRLLSTCAASEIFIGDVPSGLRALSNR